MEKGRKRLYPLKHNGWNEAERLQIAALLVKAGWCVKTGVEKQGSKTVYFIEYWEE